MQPVQPVGRAARPRRDRRIDELPDRIVQLDVELRRPNVAGRRHVDVLARAEHEGAEHAPDRLAKLAAVYCVAGLASGKPQSQAGARRSAVEAN